MNETLNRSHNEDSWKVVPGFIEPLGMFPSSFTSCVRSLITNHNDNLAAGKTGISDVSRSLLLRLMQSPTLTSMFYFASRTFKEEGVDETRELQPEDILNLYTPEELAALLSVIYLYRNLKRLCNAEEWEKYNRILSNSIEVGGHLGKMIPAIGFARGIITAAFPRLALCVLMIGNIRAYKEYRKYLREKKVTLDFEKEEELFGCTSAQVGSRMLQYFGFGKDYVKSFYFGVSDTGDEMERTKEAYAFTVCHSWICALTETGEPPRETLGDDYEISDEQLDRDFPILKDTLSEGSQFMWLEKGKAHLAGRVAVRERGGASARSSEKKPEGIQQSKTAKAPSGVDYSEFPEEVQAQFSAEEIEGIVSSVQDLLD